MATSSRARYVSVLANTLNSSGKITSDNVLLPDSGVTAGSYGSASQVPVLTVDSKGRVTSASVTSVAGVTAYSYNTSSGRMTINTADGGSFTADVTLAPFSTTNLTEGTNQYFTTARARSSISSTGTNLSYNSTTGVLSYTQGNTDTVAEGATNLYYTDARARGALSYTTGSANYNSTSGQFTIPSTTSHITEGSNLYYTDSRVRAALAAGTGVTYNSSTGTFSIGQPVATTDNVTFANVTASGNLTIAGNLTVSGTTTTVNSTTVSVADINIEVARNATTAAQANGAGITVTGPIVPATLTYSSADDRWNLNKDLNINRVYGNVTGALNGNASTASTLQTTRSITATGDASWTVNFDGSTNVSGALTLANSGVTAGSYGSGTAIPVLTIDSKGRVTSASTVGVVIGDGTLTVSAGDGLAGSGTFTANQTTNNTITISHADTSSVANLSSDNAGNTFIQDLSLTFDTYGHVTGATVATGTVSVGDGVMTVIAGSGLTGGGQVGTANQTGASSVTLSLATVGTAGTYTKVTTDAYGRITSGTTLSASDIPSLSATYLPLSGGTLTGRTIINVTGRAFTVGGSPGGAPNATIATQTSYLEISAGSGGNTNSSALIFHNPNVSTSVLEYVNTSADNAYFNFRSDDTTWNVRVNGNQVWHAGNLTNLNQLTNGPGYITGESDTLATVTARGASTSTSVTLSSNGNQYSGHLYYLPHDSAGNHYPHFNDGASASGSKINWRLFTGGTNSITHTWRTDYTYFANRVESAGDMRSPLFYDSNDTAWYVDPNSTTRLSSLTVVNTISGNISGNADTVDNRHADYFYPSNTDNGYSTGDINGNTTHQRLWAPDTVQDMFAFNPPTTVEYSTNGSTWTSSSISSDVFSGKMNGQWGGFNANVGNNIGGWRFVRLTWQNFGYRFFSHFTLAHSTNGHNFNFVFYKSSLDGSTWTEAFRQNGISSWPGYTVTKHSNVSGWWDTRDIRIVFELNHSGSADNAINIGHIGLHGSYGGFNRLFDWNGSKAITFNGNITAPILYDSNDTSYYLNPNSTSVLNAVNYWGVQFWNGDGVYARGTNSYGYRFNNYADTINAFVINNSGDTTSYSSSRAPIFYDSNDTYYYTNPNSWSQLSHANFNSSPSGRTLSLGGDQTNRVYNDSARASLVINASYYPHLYLNAVDDSGNTTHGAVLSMTGVLTSGGYRRWGMGISNRNPNELSFGWHDNDSNPHNGVGINWSYPASMWIDTGHNLYARGSMRAPIFYDYNDTSYYVDPSADLSVRVYGEICNSNYAQGNLQPGTLNIGRIDTDYRWDGTSWSGDIRVGMLANCSEYWEFAIHDSGDSVMSALYFDGGSTIYMGRNLGWGSCSVYVGGNITAASDVRLKENIVTIDNALNKTLSLRGVNYTRKDDNEKTLQIGLIAQEVLEVVPEAVVLTKEGTYGVHYGNLVGLLVEAIKEQDDKITRLEALVETLINKLGEK